MEYYCIRFEVSEELAYELMVNKEEKFTMSRTWYYLRHWKNRREVVSFKKKNEKRNRI